MKQTELNEVLEKHKKWLRDEKGGKCADLRGADLRGGTLICAELQNADLRGADLRGANLRGADLWNADLRNADLREADLSGANLCGAVLGGANLPKIAKVKNIFTKIKEAINAGSVLDMSDWHTCETAHCLAGWATTLAGKAGEEKFGTPLAAALIINESCPYLEGKVPSFYVDKENAMEFINECAEQEASDEKLNSIK